jgi:16S rRNA (cytosine1402-N4)-methyltransferase
VEREFVHQSVLLSETIDAVLTKPGGIYVDCTLGGGGHAEALLKRLGKAAQFIGIDQDPEALRAAAERLEPWSSQIRFVKSRFDSVGDVLDTLQLEKVDGLLFDLGVSSYQLDRAERGFSYMQDGPLDMRMDPEQRFSAYDLVNSWSEAELVRILFAYGEEKFARRIAGRIVEKRAVQPIQSTLELSEIIKYAIPAAARREGPHPAKRSFQAIRIAVNEELGILERTIRTAVSRLNTGGRIAIITFHSLEDRIVKTTFASLLGKCVCPPRSPLCVCGSAPTIKLIGKGITPSDLEIELNPRSRSARLRVAEKV